MDNEKCEKLVRLVREYDEKFGRPTEGSRERHLAYDKIIDAIEDRKQDQLMEAKEMLEEMKRE